MTDDRSIVVPLAPSESWDAEDSAAACAQGWDVFEACHDDERGACIEIERIDETRVFDGDASATEHVIAAAWSGDVLATKALRLVTEGGRFCPHCRADIDGNDPHLAWCPRLSGLWEDRHDRRQAKRLTAERIYGLIRALGKGVLVDTTGAVATIDSPPALVNDDGTTYVVQRFDNGLTLVCSTLKGVRMALGMEDDGSDEIGEAYGE